MADNKFKFGEMLSRLNRAKVDMPKKIAEAGRFYFRWNFEKQQSPDGIKWAPLKKPTNRPMLVRTGNLKRSMDNTVQSYSWKKVVWGSNVSYAKYLNFGTNKMVARPFITTNGREIEGKIKGVIKTEFDKIMLLK